MISPGIKTGIPGGYGQMSSAQMRSTALSAATVSAWEKKASRGERGGSGRGGVGRGGVGERGGWEKSCFLLLASSLNINPLNPLHNPLPNLLLSAKIVKALTKLSISVSVFPKLIINVKCCGIGNSAVTARSECRISSAANPVIPKSDTFTVSLVLSNAAKPGVFNGSKTDKPGI